MRRSFFLCKADSVKYHFAFFLQSRLCDNVFMRRLGATSAKRPLQIMVRTVDHYPRDTPTCKQLGQNNTKTNTTAVRCKMTKTSRVNHFVKHTLTYKEWQNNKYKETERDYLECTETKLKKILNDQFMYQGDCDEDEEREGECEVIVRMRRRERDVRKVAD